jgi:predicted dehydrogenase
MTDQKCRWGFLSAAGIAKKNWRAILKSGNGELKAVAARHRASASDFIAACQSHSPMPAAPEAVEGYAALLDRDDIDAVYIPLPTAIRAEWIRKALEAGKHVLAEKPAGIDATEVRGLVELASLKRLQFMDGVMFMHSKRLGKMKEVLEQSDTVGKLKRLVVQFSFHGDSEFKRSNIRSLSQFEPHGCLGDLGWYCIRFILWAKNYQLPKQVVGRTLGTLQGEGGSSPVPGEFSAELFFEDGCSAGFYCSFVTENQQWAHVSGERGSLLVKDFVLPFYGGETRFETNQAVFLVDGCDFLMQERTSLHVLNEYSEGHGDAQEIQLFRRFAEIVISGKLEPHWGEITLKTQQVLDACFASSMQNSLPKAIV